MLSAKLYGFYSTACSAATLDGTKTPHPLVQGSAQIQNGYTSRSRQSTNNNCTGANSRNGLMVNMWLVGFTKLKNIVVLICWKVKCGGSQSQEVGGAASTRRVQGHLDSSLSGFQTLACLLKRFHESIFLLSIFQFFALPGGGGAPCCRWLAMFWYIRLLQFSIMCCWKQSQISEVVKRSHFDFYQYYHSLAIIMLQ